MHKTTDLRADTGSLMSYLRQCFVCHGHVSMHAAMCPHCGEPDFIAQDKETYDRMKELREEIKRREETLAEMERERLDEEDE